MSRRVTVTLAAAFLLTFSGCLNGDSGRDSSHQSADLEQWRGETSSKDSDLIDRVIGPFNRGVALMDQFQPAEAVKAFEEVVRLAPQSIAGRLNLGIALLNAHGEEDYSRAEEQLRWVIQKDPDNPYARYSLGMLLRHLNRFEAASEQFETVLRIDPEDADAHYQLGALLVEKDPLVARGHFEKTLRKMPHHEAACYRLQVLLRKAGEKKRAQELLLRFRALKVSGAGATYGMKYGEMGRYAEVVRTFADPVSRVEPNTLVAYTDGSEKAGLTLIAEGFPAWPGEANPGNAAAFGPGVAVADLEGKGDLYTYITGLGPGGQGALYHYISGQFSMVKGTGIDGQDAIGAYFGDYDSDGDPDLYLTCVGPNRLYRNDGGTRFTDVTRASGTGGGAFVSVGAAWADADHDGDLDLYVANFSSSDPNAVGGGGAPNVLWRNNSNGSFTEVASQAGIDGGSAATIGVTFFDVDDDQDLDLYLVNNGSTNRIFLNDRIGRYTDATPLFPELADDGPGLGALLGDLDRNGRQDLLLLRGPKPPRLFLQLDRGRFVEDRVFAEMARGLGGTAGGLFGDLDLDGDLDLVLLSAGGNGETRHQVLMNRGTGRFDPPVPLGASRAAPDSRGAVCVDLDGDGSLELLVTRIGARPELWQAPAPRDRHWLEVIPAWSKGEDADWIEPGAEGLLVELKSGRRIQVARVTGSAGYLGAPPRRVLFGLGSHAKADYLRLDWSDGVFQSELEVAADQLWPVSKTKRKPSSCPILFCWDGERFAFVTDFLGGGGLGFFVAPGEYAKPDPSEDVRIPPELVVAGNGRYRLRVVEHLEEVTYLDELHLTVYDHPGDWELYPDERFTVSSPLATGRPFAVARKIFPKGARNDRGEDVLDRLLKRDRRYVEPPADDRFVGYADDHWIELDFGDQCQHFDSDVSLVLYLFGWVEYTYSHLNYAAYQAGIRMRSPSIEVPDGKGGWRVALPEIGFPAGLPRMMTLDISSLPIRKAGRLRIRSNMEVFWDQIFVGENVVGPKLRVSTLRPIVAQLRPLGYPQEFSPDGADPTLYDYHRLERGVPFKHMSGDFTRFSDVRELLETVDDRFVIMARGEEIALEFDATALPRLPPQWTRTLVLHTDGYCKDMDLYTAFPESVEPLPRHGMKNYPPREPAPDIKAVERYQRRWNTRHIAGR